MWLLLPYYPKHHFDITAAASWHKAAVSWELRKRFSIKNPWCRSTPPNWSIATNKRFNPWNTSRKTKLSLHESTLPLVPSPGPCPPALSPTPSLITPTCGKLTRAEWIVALSATEGVVYVPELPTSAGCSLRPVYLALVMVSVTGDWQKETLIYSRWLQAHCPAFRNCPELWPLTHRLTCGLMSERVSVCASKSGVTWKTGGDTLRGCLYGYVTDMFSQAHLTCMYLCGLNWTS